MRSTCTSLSSAVKMATFNAKSFEKKLNAMDLSQTSVQTVSLWIIHHRQHVKEILSIWIDMMKKGKTDRKLVLFYLANDVVQNSRKKSKELIQYFGKAFRETIPYMNEKKINLQVERVFKIWEERKVYEKDFVDKLRSLHSSGSVKKEKAKVSEASKTTEKVVEKLAKQKAAAKPLPPDFKMSAVMNMIVSMKELESEISTQDSQMSSLKVDASDLEAVKQVKDRSGVNKFVKEFEESKEKLDLYCNKLSRCINDKRALIDMLSHSETYYDAAYEEAKVIVHAYKTFGSRLSSMKRKVESKVKKLKVKWEEKQKEKEENKNSKPEYEVEPISDAEEQSEFQPIGDLVQSGLQSLAAKKTELSQPEDPTVDNIDVLDMDLGSDSENETPDGPLYDPSSVMYDPNDAGKDLGDNSQPSEIGDSSDMSLINIPNPEDVFKNIMGQNESTRSSALKPMGIMIDGKLQTVSLSDGNMIVGTEGQQAKSILHTSIQNASSLRTTSSTVTASVVATEPSGSLLNNEAMSPISDDSVPSPEGTPEGLVLEKDQAQQNDAINQLTVLPSSSTFPAIIQSSQFPVSGQFSMIDNSTWSTVTTTAPLNSLDMAPNPHLGGISDLPPPPMFPGLANAAGQLSFEQPIQGFIGDQVPIGSSIGQLTQSNILTDQFQLGSTGLTFSQPELSFHMPVSESFQSMSTASSTTPTQDESEGNTVRPIDILSQLLNKGKKSKKDRSSDKSERSDKERSHSSEHGRDHKTKEHGRHRKSSSSRRRSADRHHPSEALSEHGDSGHSSSRRSHHRRRSRGHSREKHSHAGDKEERREGSVDDNSEDSYLKSPKISRMSSELSNDAGDNKLSVDARNERVARDDSLDNRPTTLFDRRRAEREQATETGKTTDSNRLKREGSHISDLAELETDNNDEKSGRPKLTAQYSTDSDVFIQQQKSLDGQAQGDDFHLNQQAPWTQTEAPQKHDNFYYNAQRSPTPEMDKFQSDPLSQLPQTFVSSALQQPGVFVPASIPQFDMQPATFTNEPMLGSQPLLNLRPNIPTSVDVRPIFPQSFHQETPKDHALQRGFDMHTNLSQSPFLQGEQSLSHENRGGFQQQQLSQHDWDRHNVNEGLTYQTEPQHRQDENIPGSSNDLRFQAVEPQMASSMHFSRPTDIVQGGMQPTSSPFSPDRPLPMQDNSFSSANQHIFRQMRPGLRHEVPHMYQKRGVDAYNEMQSRGRRRGESSEFNVDMAGEFQNDTISQKELNQGGNYNHRDERDERGFHKQMSEENFRDFSGRQNIAQTGRLEFAQEDDVTAGHANVSFSKRTHEDNQMPLNGILRGQNQDMGEPFESMGHPAASHHIRNRFRHPGPGMRGPRPFRPNRPAGFPQQRPRFRPPLRPRLPQGYAPRRPIF